MHIQIKEWKSSQDIKLLKEILKGAEKRQKDGVAL